jgi:hypothetical protein
MMSEEFFNSDDIFLIGNIAGRAIGSGRGDEAQLMLRFLQVERPQNAGPHLLQATYLHSDGQLDSAIEYLEDADVFHAQTNGTKAFIFYIEMLVEKGEFNRVYREVRDYRAAARNIDPENQKRIEAILVSMKTNTAPTAVMA